MADQQLTPDSFMAAQKAADGPPPGLRPVLNPDSFMQSQVPSAPQRASEAIPTPQEVEQQTTNRARALVDVATRPGPAPPPNPILNPPSDAPQWQRDMYEAKFGMPAPESLGTAFREPVEQMAGGAGRIVGAKSPRDVAGGASQAFRGTLGAFSGPEMMAPTIASTPVRALASVGGFMGGQEAVERGLTRLGLPKEYAAVIGDLAGLVVGHFSSHAAEVVKQEIGPVLRKKFIEETKYNASVGKPAPGAPEQQYTSTGQPIRSELTPDTFMQQTAAPKENITHEETQVTSPQGRLGPGARAVQPGTADAAAGQAQAVPATSAPAAQIEPLKPGSTPPTVYHGTGNDFGEFEEGRSKDGSLYGPGYYHTEDPTVASSYAKGGTPNVRPAKLDIRNVFDVDAPADPKLAQILGSQARTNHELYHDALVDFGNKSEVNGWLEANGYDGITHVGGKRAGKGKRLHRVWIALHPDQVKPAFSQAAETRTKAREVNAGTINPDERQPTTVDAGTTRPVDSGATGEGRSLQGPVPPSAGRAPGEDTDILIPGEERSIRGRYEVRELADVQPSHNGQTFSANPKYAHQNERDYSKPENQQRVIEQSSEERFEPRYHITDNPDATNGPIVIDEDGNALGGNSRAMHLQRVYGRDAGGAAAYRALLEKKAAQFGIDPNAVRGMKQPVLVRAVSNADLESLPGAQKYAIRKTNVTGTAQLSASERSAADAGQLHPDMVEHIANAIDAAGPDATLNDALTGRSGTAIANRLISEGFFTEQERPALMDGKTGALTQFAKDRIAKAMVGKFFRDSDQIARTPLSIKAKLERIAAPLAKVQGNGSWDLTPAIREAVDLIEYAGAHGIKNLDDVTAQQGMFGDTPEWKSDAISLAGWLRDRKPNDIVAAVRRYVNDREPTMFGESTPGEAFAQHFGGEKVERAAEPPPVTPAGNEPATKPAAGPTTAAESVPGAATSEESALADHPPEVSKADDGVYFGSGLGVLEPLFREAKAEGDALRLKRNAALDAVRAARAKPEQIKAGEKLRAWFTSERDLWAARANQALDIVSRNVLPKIQDREALGIMREFRHKPVELLQFIEGTHPFLDEANGGSGNAMNRLEKLQPVMRNALRMMTKATDREAKADRLYTNIAEKSLQEGQKGGWLASRWKSDEYVPHMVNPKGEGEVATPPSTEGRAMGKIGKFFGFGQRRADIYPTMVHAVADGLIPKTLDPSAAFTVHADRFAQARATHLLEGELAESGLGKWGNGKHIPEGWVQLAKHSDEFKKSFAAEVPDSRDPEGGGGGELRVGTLGLYVPEFIDKALSPIADPDYTPKMPGFAKLRTAQRGLKQAILGLSGFHLLTENVMAKADMGPSAMYQALKSDRASLPSLMNERDLIASGGSTSIQGSTMDAYRNLKPGTIPTRGEVIRAYVPGSKQALEVADAITRLTFDNVQRKFKIWSFALHRDAWLRDNPDATPEQFAEAKKGIASYVNGVYGGLHWENMGIPRAMVEVARALLLAPDWSGSNLALGKYAVDAPLSRQEFGSRRLAGAVTKEAVQARLARAFWTKQAIQGLTENQMLSLLFSGKLSPRPFQVYQGKDKDGQGVYQNVVFRGSMGDLISLGNKLEDHGLLTGAGVFAGSKAAPFTKAGIHVMTGRDDLGREIAPRRNSFAANTVRSIGALGSDVSPIPLTLRSVQRTMMSDQSDKYKWSERMLGLFGPQAQHVPPSGMHMTSHGLRDDREKPPRSFFEQVTGHKAR